MQASEFAINVGIMEADHMLEL